VSKFVSGVEFVTEICCSCGMSFAMTTDFQRRRLKDREWFYCPSGHWQHYTGKSEEQKLREELERKQRVLESEQRKAITLQRQRDDVVRAHKRMRERVRNGVCPCCNRTFQNLMGHMRTEHPDFADSRSLKVMRSAFGLTQRAVAEEAGVLSIYISLHENGKPVPTGADERINAWIERNSGTGVAANG
jgi:DNA-binding XRE family transcriptional regulator